jgi:hypothetical protein
MCLIGATCNYSFHMLVGGRDCLFFYFVFCLLFFFTIDWKLAMVGNVSSWVTLEGLVNGVLTPLSTIVQLHRGGQFYCWSRHERALIAQIVVNPTTIRSRPLYISFIKFWKISCRMIVYIKKCNENVDI